MRQWYKSASSGNAVRALSALGSERPLPALLVALALLAVLWVSTVQAVRLDRAAAVGAIDASLADLADTYEAQVARNLGGIEQTLKTISYAVKLRGTDGALAALRDADLLPPGLIFAVSVADAHGVVVASNPPAAQAIVTSVATQPFFVQHRGQPTDAVQVSGAAPGHQGAPLVHFTKRLSDAGGAFLGVAMLDVDPAYFTSGYERARHGAQGTLALFGDSGTILALRVGDQLSANVSGVPPATLAGAAASSWDGLVRLTATRSMRRLRLTALVGLGQVEQMSAFEARRNTSLWQAGATSVLLLAAVGAFFLWTRQGAQTRRSIRLAQETYAAASENNKDAFFVLHSIVDGDGAIVDFQITAANRQAEALTGMRRQDLQRKTLSAWMPDTFANGIFDKLVHATTAGGVHESETANLIPQLKAAWLHEQLVGVEGGVVAIMRDVTERKNAEAKIFHMAQHDSLTGTPNRSLLTTRLQQAISHADRRHSSVLVAFIDLDNFKMVNDGLGHSAGDQLLAQVSARMRACLRRQDTLARFGGDEFVVVLPVYRNRLDVCIDLLDRINAVVRRSIDIAGQSVQVSCSIGTALYPHDGDTADTLLVRADVAMYHAKAAGKNQCRFYTAAMNASAGDKLALVAQLRLALDAGQFHILYQPKFEVHGGRLYGVEALLRWHHPERGLVSPVEFIPLAEESGVIIALGRWVMQQACAQSVAWQQAGLPALTMSVNVSPRQFDDIDLQDDVAAALAASGLAPRLLELEVTESLIMRDLHGAIAKMASLKAMGLLLSIDDFGTGYSSLSSLKSFPITTLKIDKSFVSELATSVDDQAICRAIIALAHQLNLRVIAEGVETSQQFDFLRDNGCDEVQGYLFGRPSTPAMIAGMLAAQQASAPAERALA
ncbi:bifunctional diguanylate cyclase/phosphodiesterase [Massilia sp. PWRC2]|uniref:bifunctional diguanylate cyclase/phosphodiesterase n=1 Tax=Massilia sp. PWRC2 TaxID=2804626 RepID=UPI003CEE6AF8